MRWRRRISSSTTTSAKVRPGMDRKTALADFETAREEWDGAFAQVPDGALTYLKPGDDYSLGGFQVHVNWVLAHYRRVLDAIVAGGFAQIGPQDPPGAGAEALEGAGRGRTRGERNGSPDEVAPPHRDGRAARRVLP